MNQPNDGKLENHLARRGIARWVIDFDINHAGTLRDVKDAGNRLKRLRQSGCDLDQCTALMELWDCRDRAKTKFTNADQLFFTRRSYEQSSGERLADWKRLWIQNHAPVSSKSILLDLCCGMGGDAITFNRSMPVLAVDLDSALVEFAQENLKRCHSSFPNLVMKADVTKLIEFPTVKNFGQLVQFWKQTNANETSQRLSQWCEQNQLHDHQIVWHLDPDRRSTSGRHIRLEDFSPDLDFIQALRNRFPIGLLKVAPATDIPEQWQANTNWVWLGDDRECKQLVACIHGDDAAKVKRSAAVWNGTQEVWDTFCVEDFKSSQRPLVPMSRTIGVGDRLLEFHSAIYTSGLADALAASLGAKRLESDSYFLVESEMVLPHSSQLYSVFEILSVLPAKAKAILAEIRSRSGRLVEIKKRKAETQMQSKMLKELKSAFSNKCDLELSILLISCGSGGKVQAVLAQRLR